MKMKMKKATTRRCEKRAKGVWLLNGNPWGGQKEKGILKENLTVWKAKSDRFCQESPGSSRLIFWIGEEAKKVLYFPYFHNISFDPFDKVGVLSSQLEGNRWKASMHVLHDQFPRGNFEFSILSTVSVLFPLPSEQVLAEEKSNIAKETSHCKHMGPVIKLLTCA